MPKVSVLMPVYRTPEKYLREAIESILSQTFTDFEFLILDDCPEDNRKAIVQSYKDKRIKYIINEQNLGISQSRNKLIKLAKGKYLAVFDHDDISLPSRLEKQVAYLENHPETGVVGSYIKKSNSDKVRKNPVSNHDIKLALMSVSAITHPAAMIRKDVLTKNHIAYEEEFSPAEDYALWGRLISCTDFYNIPEVLFIYREHETNTTKLQRNKMENAGLAVRAFIKASNPALYEEFLLKAENVTSFRLFGFIPLIKTARKANKTKCLLFGKIPLFTLKKSAKIKC